MRVKESGGPKQPKSGVDMKKSVDQKHTNHYYLGLLSCAVIGMIFVLLLYRQTDFCQNQTFSTFLEYQKSPSGLLMLYGNCYLVLFLQASLLLALSFCCFGIVLLPALFILYGGILLYHIIGLYSCYALQGLYFYWVVLWLPITMGFMLLARFSAYGYGNALGLAKCVFTNKSPSTNHIFMKKTLFRYFSTLLQSALVAGSAVILSFVFGSSI